jgi:thioredoxin reductase (NADPH)
MIGADPATEWLRGSGIALDDKRFVRTGVNGEARTFGPAPGADRPFPHETNRPGVFAVGDVRAHSIKRVGAAVGDGAAVTAELHRALAAPPAAAPVTSR